MRWRKQVWSTMYGWMYVDCVYVGDNPPALGMFARWVRED